MEHFKKHKTLIFISLGILVIFLLLYNLGYYKLTVFIYKNNPENLQNCESILDNFNVEYKVVSGSVMEKNGNEIPIYWVYVNFFGTRFKANRIIKQMESYPFVEKVGYRNDFIDRTKDLQ